MGTSYARLEWVHQGSKPEDLPGTKEKKLWPLWNLAKYQGPPTSRVFGPLFEEEANPS